MAAFELSPSDSASWRHLTRRDLLIPLIVLCTGVLLHSMNALLMSTVMPSAVRDIGGLEYMSWPTTAFLATSVVSASSGSLFRALAGARAGYALAALVFGLGSLVAGLASDIGWLVIGRAIQGLGGGLVSSIAYVIIRNVFPANLWPRTFALLSGIWGIAVLIGPLMGGVFAGMGFWRGSFLVVAIIAGSVACLAFLVLPRDHDRPPMPAFPGIRLALIGLGITGLSLAATTYDMLLQLSMIALSVLVFVIALNLDRRARQSLLPSDAFSVTTKVGLGIWVMFLVSVANDPFPIYGPMFLQTLHNLSPLTSGYLVAIEAMAWTLVAAAVASLPRRFVPYCVVLGPFVMGLGLVGISLFTQSGPFWLLIVAIFLAGGGIGAAFSFLSQAILGSAREGEGDAAASSIPTIQLVGLGVGAAFAGLVANVTGFSHGLSIETASAAALWVPGIFAIATILASIAALILAPMLGTATSSIKPTDLKVQPLPLLSQRQPDSSF